MQEAPTTATSEEANARLTEAEDEVLRLLLDGKSDKQIADARSCSPRTVHFHLRRIYVKLGVGNRYQAVHRATRLGLAA